VFFTIPPLVVLIPAMLTLGIQIAAAIICVAAVVPLVMNGFVQPDFGLLYGVLAPGSVVGVCYRNGYKPGKRGHHNRCNCCFSNSLNQGFLLSNAAGTCR
jgi:hypothetical protein